MISYKHIDPDYDIPQVLAAAFIGYGITLTDVELVLKIVSLSLACIFTIYKIANEIHKRRELKRKARKENLTKQ